MASNFDDPSQWRLKTSNGIPYKVLGMEGRADDDTASADLTLAIRGSDLLSFMTFLMPVAQQIGFALYPQVQTLAGLPTLAVQGIQFRSFDDALPIDPFSSDTSASSGTYYEFLEVVVTYSSTVKKRQTSQSDPRTFLEISANSSGEFIHSPATGAKIREETNNNADPNGDEDAQNAADTDTGKPDESSTTVKPGVDNRDPNLPITFRVPTTEWTLTWNQIPYKYFNEVLYYRLEAAKGRVNRSTFRPLFNAHSETLLFMSYDLREKHTWREGFVATPPVSVSMKIVQKSLVKKGIVIGHNHVWKPGTGWIRYEHADGSPLYDKWDFNKIFKV